MSPTTACQGRSRCNVSLPCFPSATSPLEFSPETLIIHSTRQGTSPALQFGLMPQPSDRGAATKGECRGVLPSAGGFRGCPPVCLISYLGGWVGKANALWRARQKRAQLVKEQQLATSISQKRAPQTQQTAEKAKKTKNNSSIKALRVAGLRLRRCRSAASPASPCPRCPPDGRS